MFRRKQTKVTESEEHLESLHFEEQHSNNEEPHEDDIVDSSQSLGKETWKDISGTKDKVVQTIDAQGRRGTRKGIITPSLVWTLPHGVKFMVEFNVLKQPIEKGGFILINFLGDIAKKGSLCPIGEKNWHHVQQSYKVEIVKIVRTKFDMPMDIEIDEGILSKVGNAWRGHKYQLKRLYFDPKKTQLQNENAVPKDVVKEQWVRLVCFWFTPKSEELSTVGKRARAGKDDVHTSGSKSYAQKRNEFVQQHEREPISLEFYNATHLRKDGSYVEKSNSKEFMDTATKMVDESMNNSTEIDRTLVEEEVFTKLMYDDDKPNQRVIGYGHGVSRSKVFGLKAQLEKNRGDHIDTSASTSKKELDVVKKENKQLKTMCSTLMSNLSIVTKTLAKYGIVIDLPCETMSTESVESDDNMDH